MPRGLGVGVGGASATMTLLKPLGKPTGVVLPVRIGVQVTPPSLEVNAPRPAAPRDSLETMPAYRIRAPGGEVGSSTSERTSPPEFTPNVQFCPPLLETQTPLLAA